MSAFYFYLLLLNAAVSVLVAIGVIWKNRYQTVGPLFGTAMLINAVWLFGFAQYFRSLPPTTAFYWAHITLAASILNQPFLFHSMIALVGRLRAFRWWIFAAYIAALFFLALLCSGVLVSGLRSPAFLHHYIQFNPRWYPVLSGFCLACQWTGAGILIWTAARVSGYQRAQLTYFTVAWLISFLATSSVILPIEYDLDIPPFGFLVMPLNLAILAYVMTQARLMEINLAIGKVFLFVATLAAVMMLVFAVISAVNHIDPRFLGGAQTLFVIALVTVVSALLAFTLPRFAPYVEQVLQSRLFGDRYRYQQAVSELIGQVATIPSADQLPQF